MNTQDIFDFLSTSRLLVVVPCRTPSQGLYTPGAVLSAFFVHILIPKAGDAAIILRTSAEFKYDAVYPSGPSRAHKQMKAIRQ